MQILKIAKLIGFVCLFNLAMLGDPLQADEVSGLELIPDGEAEDISKITEIIQPGVRQQFQKDRFAHRDAHAKHHGCVLSEFQISNHLDQTDRQGVFSEPGRIFPAWIRYSNASGNIQKDSVGDARGMAIKLLNVQGPKLLVSERDEKFTQDFLMINYPVFFIKNVHDYVGFIEATTSQNSWNGIYFFANPFHWYILPIVTRISLESVKNPLAVHYFSATPYLLGESETAKAIKYSFSPCSEQSSLPTTSSTSDDFLREAMAKTLEQQNVCFDFKIQTQTQPNTMPIEDPTVLWSETESPYRKVAEIHIHKQSFMSETQQTFCENLSMTPWHSLPAHRPLGGVNRGRKAVYSVISELRHQLNQAPLQEPTADDPFRF